MKIAVPHYMRDMQQSAPGHRFNLYFPIWDAQWEIGSDAKIEAAKSVLAMHSDDHQRMEALTLRQQSQALALGEVVVTYPAVSTAPFVSGMGYEHPLENGFAFLTPYGLPYLPGSSIKGVLRRAAEEIEIDGDLIAQLFGSSADAGEQGALSFWDLFPQGDLALDIMTPHHSGYLQKTGTPHDSESPTPLPFLTVAPGAKFTFRVQRIRPLKCDWHSILQQCFNHAFDWLGFGAKTAVGYGAMQFDAAAENAFGQARQKEAEKRGVRAQHDAEVAQLAAMTPLDRELAQLEKLQAQWGDHAKMLDDIEAYLQQYAPIDPKVSAWLGDRMDEKYNGIMTNPDATQGRKMKPKYKERPRKIAASLQSP
ncbi:MAG: type III-B CRISPR module RAMP protein Cmr6 [Mariprofundales bacterium]|nr:type III-B CRISPR module RAMP protein Cmr6 [Mariprofundales bacterium]